VGVPGLEPGTSILSGSRSNQLSYTPTQKRLYHNNMKIVRCQANMSA
jgi:hypothetical protein